MFGGLSPTELLLILAIVLIVFGVGKLPDVGKGLGKGIREFRDAFHAEEIEQAKPPEKKDEPTAEKKDEAAPAEPTEKKE
jgi:sec-independent protein translocase protein TatA